MTRTRHNQKYRVRRAEVANKNVLILTTCNKAKQPKNNKKKINIDYESNQTNKRRIAYLEEGRK